jgi:predicted TIM-barrel fold metal-dependent hydrolase
LHAAIGFDGPEAPTGPLARDINDELAEAIRANPARLGGFATFALRDPTGAAVELERW